MMRDSPSMGKLRMSQKRGKDCELKSKLNSNNNKILGQAHYYQFHRNAQEAIEQ